MLYNFAVTCYINIHAVVAAVTLSSLHSLNVLTVTLTVVQSEFKDAGAQLKLSQQPRYSLLKLFLQLEYTKVGQSRRSEHALQEILEK